jgi:hypothetical protein
VRPGRNSDQGAAPARPVGRTSPPVDTGTRLFVFCCAASFVAIAASVVIVVVKFLL